MEATTSAAIVALNRRFLLDYPHVAAQRIETMLPDEAAEALHAHDANTLVPVVLRLSPEVAAELLASFDQATVARLLAELPPGDAARILASLELSGRDNYLGWLEASVAREIQRALEYPADSAGHLMETRIARFRGSFTVGETLARLRKARAQATRSLFIVDEDNRLSGRASIQDIALAPPETRLDELARPVAASVSALAPTEEVVELLERSKLADLPVIDIDGGLLGIIYQATMLQVIQEDATADIQTMVGASKDERALSPTLFAVRKRLPWMQINLLTAFLAASVVGLFEGTIARFTALAILLPVVAGQAGNAGAQALAVTMRGLALREIGLRHWFRVTRKEVQTGLINGLAVALTCGIGVFVWSGSPGLVLVIAVSMVLAMVAAGFAGALVPILLTRFGQDPAQSSSIILTTVTDVAGFFSFLGIATLLAGML